MGSDLDDATLRRPPLEQRSARGAAGAATTFAASLPPLPMLAKDAAPAFAALLPLLFMLADSAATAFAAGPLELAVLAEGTATAFAAVLLQFVVFALLAHALLDLRHVVRAPPSN